MSLEELYKEADAIKQIARSINRGRAIRLWFEKAMQIETDECILWPFAKINGYGNISGDIKLVHVLSARIKLGSKPDSTDAAHGNCHERSCFNYRHLSYKTRSQNNEDKVRDGTDSRGEKCIAAKLSNKEIQDIRISWPLVNMTMTAFAKIYGISLSHMSSILSNNDRVLG